MTPLVQTVTTILSLGIIGMQVFALLLILALFAKPDEVKNRKGIGAVVGMVSEYVLEIGFLVSLGAIISSMFYSSIAGFAPCEFCWWQRILIYPQAVLFAVAIYYKKKGLPYGIALTSSLIMSIMGAALSLFQYYGAMFNPSLLEACIANGVSCSKQYFIAFGYITIPLMSLTCFVFLILLIVTRRKVEKIA
ncbi:MAG: disulfide bond formation protein [Candidatus Paceibacter sp.]|jgi:disulfide bond formation protein DsbB|nr:disulfide bond formation protein [Candidatus Paceibacter sp.]